MRLDLLAGAVAGRPLLAQALGGLGPVVGALVPGGVQAIADRMSRLHPGREQAAPVSSIHNTVVPPACRATTRFSSRGQALPRWNMPVGRREPGANRGDTHPTKPSR